jgi:hypothetical protein
VVNWPWRRRGDADAPKVRSRSADSAARRVDLADLTPGILDFLGQSAYLQLTLFENATRAVQVAPTAEAKDSLSHVAAASLRKHHGLTALITRHGADPGALMEPFMAGIDEFQRRTRGEDWNETLMTCYLTAGFLDDFFVRLAAGLPRDYPERVVAVLGEDAEHARLVALLSAQIAANARLSSRLALWGRRLVGDTMLVARSALGESVDTARTEERIEPVFTELIANHSRRMDGLGLTA